MNDDDESFVHKNGLLVDLSTTHVYNDENVDGISSENYYFFKDNSENFSDIFITDPTNRLNLSYFLKTRSSESMVTISVLLCDLLGAICLILNIFIIITLIRNRNRMLKNVFYIIVLHCAIVDLIRGSCLIVWGLPQLLMNKTPTMYDRLFALKMNQFTLIILRSCNLLTIFNLLVFTTNEFLVIRHPLYYRRYFRRRAVLILILFSWLVSLTFGIGSVFSNFFESAHSIMVYSNVTSANSHSKVVDKKITRQNAVLSINMISMLMIFILCYLCLFIVLICYGFILRTIRKFHSIDDKDSDVRRVVKIDKFHPSQSHRINKHQKEVENQKSIEYTRRSTNELLKDSGRQRKLQLVSRHKYLIVIGSVLFVDILFLFPYSGIQLVAFLHLNNVLKTSHYSTLIRWTLQILIGIHSVCQPLCYFRMNEFRRLACCKRWHILTSSGSQAQRSIKEVLKEMPKNEEPNMKRYTNRSDQHCDQLFKNDEILAKNNLQEMRKKCSGGTLNESKLNRFAPRQIRRPNRKAIYKPCSDEEQLNICLLNSNTTISKKDIKSHDP